jgi:hypothetical protein
MVPTLRVPKDALKNNGFINGYIKDDRMQHGYDNCIYLLFKPEDLDKFREFLDNEYERTRTIIEDYDYEDGFVVVVYQLDNDFNKDFTLIRQGKYSKTSKTFQSLFPKIVKIFKNGLSKDEISLQYRIFNKSEELIEFWEDKLGINFKTTIGDDFEVWEGFDESNEILKLNKIIENV